MTDQEQNYFTASSDYGAQRFSACSDVNDKLKIEMLMIQLCLYQKYHTKTPLEKKRFQIFKRILVMAGTLHDRGIEDLALVAGVLTFTFPAIGDDTLLENIEAHFNTRLKGEPLNIAKLLADYSKLLHYDFVLGPELLNMMRVANAHDERHKKNRNLQYMDKLLPVFKKIQQAEENCSAEQRKGRNSPFAIAFGSDIIPILKSEKAWTPLEKTLDDKFPYSESASEIRNRLYKSIYKSYVHWKEHNPSFAGVVSGLKKCFENTYWKKVQDPLQVLKQSIRPLPDSLDGEKLLEELIRLHVEITQKLDVL